MAMGYNVDTPYLLLWAAIMGLEGTSFSDQRKLLTCLGWIVPYRYKAGHKVVKPLVSNRTPPFPSFDSVFPSLILRPSSNLVLASQW